MDEGEISLAALYQLSPLLLDTKDMHAHTYTHGHRVEDFSHSKITLWTNNASFYPNSLHLSECEAPKMCICVSGQAFIGVCQRQSLTAWRCFVQKTLLLLVA